MYNLLEERSFRARLAKVTYNDSRGKMKSYTQYAFLLEDVDDMAKMRWTIQHDNMFSVSPNVIAILGNEVEQGYIDDNKYLEMSS